MSSDSQEKRLDKVLGNGITYAGSRARRKEESRYSSSVSGSNSESEQEVVWEE